MYINIDTELLFEKLTQLNWSKNNSANWERYNPSISDIDKLFIQYECTEYCENFYDSEPHYNDEEFNMYMDYANIINKGKLTGRIFLETLLKPEGEGLTFSKKPHSLKELKTAYNNIVKQQKDYEKKRIRFNNWQEPYFMGNWMSKEAATSAAKDKLIELKKSSVHKKDRFWVIKYNEDTKAKGCEADICIYYYGRDYLEADYVWLFQKRKRKRN